jgi:hypothetical protein
MTKRSNERAQDVRIRRRSRTFGALTAGLPYRDARRPGGLAIDVVRLPFADATAAQRELANAGGQEVSDAEPWLKAHRRVRTDPQAAQVLQAQRRRLIRAILLDGLALLPLITVLVLLLMTGVSRQTIIVWRFVTAAWFVVTTSAFALYLARFSAT